MSYQVLAVLALCGGIFCANSFAGEAKKTVNKSVELAIIPKPANQQMGQGSFSLSNKTRLFASDTATLSNASLLNDRLQQTLGFRLPVLARSPDKSDSNYLQLKTEAPAANLKNQDETYTLAINPRSIALTGSITGQFYGMQTLLQMLPVKAGALTHLRTVNITDSPRFSWRGMHLDVGRHMVSVEFIKKFLDQMAFYKMNTFHWHLTEDQGWRIEIKTYPKLTEVGGWRKESTLKRHVEPYIGDGKPYGGFYTQEQIKEVVSYAAARHTTVVPEIELPGHAQAALAAYPELACTPGPFEVATNWGIFDDIYCPSEATFHFLENVLTEVMALFPGQYLHIGGDEVPKTRWKNSALAQDVMRREGLKNEEELQSWFIRRIEKFINSKGKRLIGWDEILEGGLAPNATVMSWRGEDGGIAAARQGHDVIMSPTSHCYFDAGQGPKEQESWELSGELGIEKVYAYNPIPAILNSEEQRHIKGLQANIWTEYLSKPEMIEYMTFPRLLAMSEVAWTAQQGKEYASFTKRLGAHYPRLQQAGLAYRIPRPTGLPEQINATDKTHTLSLDSPVAGSKMYYTLDGTVPNTSSARYLRPLVVKVKPGQDRLLQVLTVSPDGRHSAIQRSIIRASGAVQK
ncbi:beta-N-acetylhexosaminidase [Undibacterium pigrum]|uniref:beta-N-acetylhexosaminidase n=1 Tax=Undibacterium pigrum TaxID=401470 RepID=A0A318JDJ7_9BURK|nr:family 20 glycosylhydrolase [Undibacterium pigrum]PXX47031.1 hexosaminidase [Undibacterium pigrum]